MADPIQTAQLLLAAVSASIEAASLWLQTRDRKETLGAADAAYKRTLDDKRTLARAAVIIKTVPADVVEVLEERVRDCYRKFREMLEDDDAFPGDLDKGASDALPTCVCRELKRMKDAAGDFSDRDFDDAWRRYDCEKRLQARQKKS